MIAYSDLVTRITTVELQAHDSRLFHLLGEISSEEDAAGRGMLTVVVVHKTGDMQPGPGFFELAGLLGRDTSDILKCWVEELHRVHAVWSRNQRET
jgi:molybdopterin synthase catalytic subunit